VSERGAAWARFVGGRSPHPIEEPSVILTGVRPHEPAHEFAGNPECRICGGLRTPDLDERQYCAGCDRLPERDAAQVRLARIVTPMPRPERRPRSAPKPGPGETRRQRRQRGAFGEADDDGLKGGLG
jgi:hypothetical protein